MSELNVANAKLLAVNYVGQGAYGELCWAACCEMIFGYFHKPVPTLGQLASEASGKQCCPDPSSVDCDQPYWPDHIYANHGINFLSVDYALSLANIVFEINQQRPVQAVLQWLGSDDSDQGKHLVIICGYYENGDLLFMDPKYGEGRRSYDYIKSAYNCGFWYGTYYNFAAGA